MMLDEPKYWLSLIVGIVTTALGGIPLLNTWGLIKFTLPFALPMNILLWLVAAVGAYLLIDTFLSEDDMMMWTSAIVSFIILAVAIVQILSSFGIIGFSIPFISLTLLKVLFVVEGIGLIIASFGTK
jgi:hypothetical protein